MVKPEPQKLLRPRFLDSDLDPIRQWFEKHNALEKPPSGHADMIDHERASWAAALVKSWRQILTVLCSNGVVCREFSLDAMRKYPFWICATSGASPQGYVQVREDGLPEFSVADHDTPCGPYMLLSCNGVQEMAVSADTNQFDTEKPQLPVSTFDKISVFLRPHLYLPTDAVSNAKDFRVAFELGPSKPEVVLIQSDNGWDFSLHSMLQQHLMLVPALIHDSVLWAWLTQAPNHSSWNPIEKSWPIPRRLFTGQHLGSTAYPPGVNPFQGEEPTADVLRKIAQAGVKDAFKLLNTQRENGWHVHAPDEPTDPAGNPAPLPTEYVERVRAHYAGKWDEDIEKEAGIIESEVVIAGVLPLCILFGVINSIVVDRADPMQSGI